MTNIAFTLPGETQRPWRGQVSGLRVRRRNEAKGRENEAELGGSSASGPVIFNQGFNLEEHNRFLLFFYYGFVGSC